MYKFYEFFAGGGMARAGLGRGWDCLFANDFDPKKARTYQNNWGQKNFKICDVAKLNATDLPNIADLVWASFPCQNLSLAGGGAGLKGKKSGTFWPFWKLMEGLERENRPPRMIVLENVCGTITSHGGKDFSTICSALQRSSYRLGALVIDAALFVPQSRPRLFIVAVHKDQPIPNNLISQELLEHLHNSALYNAYSNLPQCVKNEWIWWSLPIPPIRNNKLSDILENNPAGVAWHTPEQTNSLLSMMSDLHLKKVKEAQRRGNTSIGCVYKRMRQDTHGNKIQRAEVRFDDIAGCLRTPIGGSSRQTLLVVKGDVVRSRLISIRETARLMGLSDKYKLPETYNEGYHLTGDGVVVPVVRYLAEHLLEPTLMKQNHIQIKQVA
jgi:DNA (cytosine-5)-methyltransferase 1